MFRQMIQAKWGTVLRTLRERKGLTQVELAKRAKLSQPYIAQLERGERKMISAVPCNGWRRRSVSSRAGCLINLHERTGGDMGGRKLGLTFALILGMIMGILTTKLMSAATAEEKKTVPKLFQHIGTHWENDNSIYVVYCDRERGNLIYSHLVAADDNANSNLVVFKDSCK